MLLSSRIREGFRFFRLLQLFLPNPHVTFQLPWALEKLLELNFTACCAAQASQKRRLGIHPSHQIRSRAQLQRFTCSVLAVSNCAMLNGCLNGPKERSR